MGVCMYINVCKQTVLYKDNSVNLYIDIRVTQAIELHIVIHRY